MKRMIVTVVVPVIAVCAGAFVIFLLFSLTANAPTTEPTGKVMSIESYVTQNISTLSPEKEVLGGTFYVTNIQVTPREGASGTGVVQYEDGHIALVADFSYEVNDRGITIKSFTV